MLRIFIFVCLSTKQFVFCITENQTHFQSMTPVNQPILLFYSCFWESLLLVSLLKTYIDYIGFLSFYLLIPTHSRDSISTGSSLKETIETSALFKCSFW